MVQQQAGAIWRRLVKMAAPIIGLNVLGVLALAIDTAMCGRLPNGEVAQTALGFATQIVFLLMVAMMGLTIGTVSLVARAHGAGDKERVNHLLQQSSALTILVALSVGAVGHLLASPLLSLLGADGPVLDEALRYLRPLLTGTVLNYLAQLYAASLRGVGNTRLPFLVALASNALNVACNYLLILGNFGFPALGVQGAAIGTVISHGFSAVVIGGFLASGKVAGLKLRLRWPRLDPALTRDLFRVGAPAALDFVILQAGFLALIGMQGRLEVIAVAAHGIGLRVQGLAFVPGMSVSQATAAMVGQRLGAADVPGARAVVRASLGLCLAVMLTLGAALLLGAEQLLEFFKVPPDTRYHELSLLWIRVLAAGMPIFALHLIFSGLIQGAGVTQKGLMINILATFAVQLPLGWLLGFPLGLGPLGVWLSVPLASILKAILTGRIFLGHTWERTGLRA